MSEFGSLEELQQLPLRAMLAYTARTVRRIQPLLTSPNEELRAWIEKAIRHVEILVEGDTNMSALFDESVSITGGLMGKDPNGNDINGWIRPQGTDAKIVAAATALVGALQ